MAGFNKINLGSAANDGTGDPLRVAGQKVNDMFEELFKAAFSLSTDQTTISTDKAVEVQSLSIQKYFKQIGIGTANLALGEGALNIGSFGGSYSTAVGHQANKSANSAAFNVAVGALSLYNGTSASKNVVVGKGAMYNALTSFESVALGYEAGLSSQGNQNVFLGASSIPEAAADSNSIVIGYAAVGKGSNTVVIGNASITDNYFFGNIHADNINDTNWDEAYGWGNHSLMGYATETYVDTAVNALVAAAPGALDTLNELAASLGNDPNFATTITNQLAALNTTNWDTAYGWGNHSLMGYATESYVDARIEGYQSYEPIGKTIDYASRVNDSSAALVEGSSQVIKNLARLINA